MRYALVRNNTIVNIIEADQAFIDQIAPQWQHIEPLDQDYEQPADIGWACINGVIQVPAPTPAPAPSVKITRLAFLNRFTDEEAIAIDLASIGATVEAASIRRYMSKVNAAQYIDLKRLDTRDGVLAMETAGLIGEGRALEILDAPLTPEELFRGLI